MLINYLPSILVPLVGLVFPAVAKRVFFMYTVKDTIE
uniref:Photosystem I reaction center subunit VIII n=1 Tax=Sargassum horneri TaxID=74089 RepID=A0A141BSI1_9PHAE|nr:PsaI [Sargassum horneri]AKO62530.1 PsaI [Sargassum horneri]